MLHRALLRIVSIGTFICVVMALLRWATTAPLTAARIGTASFDELLGLAAALGCWTLLGWVALVLAATALGSVPGALGRFGTAAASRLTPVAMRRAARLVLGFTVVTGPATVAVPVHAAPVATQVTTQSGPAAASDVLALPDVGRPGWSESATTAAVASKPARAGSSQSEVATVVVRAGDCLWTIAAEALASAAPNADSSDAAIAAEWPRWYALNRSTIGADPDLLLPGMVLRAPMTQ